MRWPTSIILVLTLLLGACGGAASTSSTEATTPSSTRSATIPVETTARPVTGVLTRAEGGTLTVTLADGDTATLAVPADALEADTLVSLVPLRMEGGVGVDLLPNGLWLDHAARLTFGRADRSILVRSSPAPIADRFSVIDGPRSSTPIIRFRPVLVTTSVPKGLVPPAPGTNGERGHQSEPGVYTFPSATSPDDVDPIDDLAETIEREVDGGRTDAPGSTRGDAVRRAAATTANEQSATCDDRTSDAASRVADTMQTAGSAAMATTKPTCVKRVLQLAAHMEGNFAAEGRSFALLSDVAGHGTFIATAAPSDLSLPLEGMEDGMAEITSFGGGAMDSALAMFAGVAAPPPSTDACTSSPLEGGLLTGTSVLTDGTIDLTLQPSGAFTVRCTDWGPFSHEPLVWTTLVGGGLEVPIRVSVPDGRNVVRVLGQLMQSEEVATNSAPNGTVTVREGSSTIVLSLSIGIFWSRADRCQLTPEERAKGPEFERQMCGAGGS